MFKKDSVNSQTTRDPRVKLGWLEDADVITRLDLLRFLPHS